MLASKGVSPPFLPHLYLRLVSQSLVSDCSPTSLEFSNPTPSRANSNISKRTKLDQFPTTRIRAVQNWGRNGGYYEIPHPGTPHQKAKDCGCKSILDNVANGGHWVYPSSGGEGDVSAPTTEHLAVHTNYHKERGRTASNATFWKTDEKRTDGILLPLRIGEQSNWANSARPRTNWILTRRQTTLAGEWRCIEYEGGLWVICLYNS